MDRRAFSGVAGLTAALVGIAGGCRAASESVEAVTMRVAESCAVVGERERAVVAEMERRVREAPSFGPGPLDTMARQTKEAATKVVARRREVVLWRYFGEAIPELVPLLKAIANGGPVPAALASCGPLATELGRLQAERGGHAELVQKLAGMANWRAQEIGVELTALEGRLFDSAALERELSARVVGLITEIAEARAEIDALAAPFRNAARVDDVRRELFLFAKRAGLTVMGAELRDRMSDDRFVGESINVRLRGPYHAVMEWLGQVHRWNQAVVVRSLSLTRGAGAQSAISAEALAITYSIRPEARSSLVPPEFAPTSALDVLQARRGDLARAQGALRRTTGLKSFLPHVLVALPAVLARRVTLDSLEANPDRLRFVARARDPLDVTRTLELLQSSNHWREVTQLSEGVEVSGGAKWQKFSVRAQPVEPEKPRRLADAMAVRDPFRTGPGESEALPGTEGRPAIERYALADLRVGGVVSSPGVPAQAIVYDPTGKSHAVKIGSKIGVDGLIGTIGLDHVIVVTREVTDGQTAWGRVRMDVKASPKGE